MGGENSYVDVGRRYLPDSGRGRWATSSDFLYACWGLAFKLDVLTMAWYMLFELGIFSFIPYLICMALFVVPIIFLQSYLGQFSSSGFISAFRISPLFKGIGYIGLALNFSILTYYSMFAAIPLFYIFHSMRVEMPWSCESYDKWSKAYIDTFQNSKIEYLSICPNLTLESTYTTPIPGSAEEFDVTNITTKHHYRFFQIPSLVFFRSLFNDYDFFNYDETMKFSLSQQLVVFMLLVWVVVALIFYTMSNSEKMGKFMRHTMWALMALMVICLFRIIYLSEASQHDVFDFLVPTDPDFSVSLAGIPILAISAFGAGWGVIISLASYNEFRTNVMRYSWFISLGQYVIMFLIALMSYIINRHINYLTDGYDYSRQGQHYLLLLCSATALAELDFANLWTILFYGLLFLAAILIIVTQLFGLLTAVFDEFEYLRERKSEVTFGLIGLLALCSIYFCSNVGYSNFEALTADAVVTQTALNLLLLLVVLWIYGRIRFQHDIEFMLGQNFAIWRIHVLRFVAPIVLLITMVMFLGIAFYEHFNSVFVVGFVSFLLIFIPWFFAVGYGFFNISKMSGKFVLRLKRSCRPSDWYPVDPVLRNDYENSLNLTPGLGAVDRYVKEMEEEGVDGRSSTV